LDNLKKENSRNLESSKEIENRNSELEEKLKSFEKKV